MDLTIKIEGDLRVKELLRQIGDQAPHAIRLAANETGESMQRAMRREIPNRFAQRGTREGFAQAVVFSKAIPGRTNRASAILKVGGPGFGQSRTQKLGVILARHEESQVRTESGQTFYDGRGKPLSAKGFFLPAKGLRTSTQNPPRKLYPTSIGAAMRIDGKMDGPYLAKGTKKGGKRRVGVSYFATDKGIFMRKHSNFGRADVEAIWWFRGRIRSPARLRMWETAEDVFNRFSLRYLEEAIETVIGRVNPT